MAKRRPKATKKKAVRVLPANPWVTFLLLLPVVAATVLLGMYYYTFMLALFSAVFAGFVGRTWWLRWQTHRAAAQPVPRAGASRRTSPARTRKRASPRH